MKINLDEADLAPIVERVLGVALEKIGQSGLMGSEQIAYAEADAAKLLGIQRHALRDARLRGEIAGAKLGKRVVYERHELLAFVRRQRIDK